MQICRKKCAQHDLKPLLRLNVNTRRASRRWWNPKDAVLLFLSINWWIENWLNGWILAATLKRITFPWFRFLESRILNRSTQTLHRVSCSNTELICCFNLKKTTFVFEGKKTFRNSRQWWRWKRFKRRNKCLVNVIYGFLSNASVVCPIRNHGWNNYLQKARDFIAVYYCCRIRRSDNTLMPVVAYATSWSNLDQILKPSHCIVCRICCVRSYEDR